MKQFVAQAQTISYNATKFEKAIAISNAERGVKYIIKRDKNFVTLFITSNMRDSIIVLVNGLKQKSLSTLNISSGVDFNNSSVQLRFNSNKYLDVVLLSMAQKKYLSFSVNNKYPLVKVFFSTDTSFITKTNKKYVLE